MSNTRTARPRPNAERPTRSTRAVEEDVEETTPAEAQEMEAEGHYITASLAGEPIRIIPPNVWRLSWNRMMRNDEIDALFEKVIHADDLEVIDEIDPTTDELVQFLQDAAELAGESLGKSNGPKRSSRSTRRR